MSTPLRRRLLAAGLGAFAGLAMGYSVAYVGRFAHLMILDSVLIGVLGGAFLLFLGLWKHLPFRGGGLVAACVLLGLSGWLGQRLGEYRFARAAAIQSGGDPALASLSPEEVEQLAEPGDLAALRARAVERFERDLQEQTGARGLWGFVRQQWRSGVVAFRLGSLSARIPLPPTAVLLGQGLGVAVSWLLAWMVLRRLTWLPSCASCGRYLDPKEGEPAAEGPDLDGPEPDEPEPDEPEPDEPEPDGPVEAGWTDAEIEGAFDAHMRGEMDYQETPEPAPETDEERLCPRCSAEAEATAAPPGR